MNRAVVKKSVSYAKGFRLLEGLVFAPLMALIGQVLRGRTVVDSTELVGFFLSPRGFSAAFLLVLSLLLIRMIEQAGLSVLRAEEFGGPSLTPLAVFKFVFARFHRLLQAAVRFIIAVGLMLAPLLISTGLVARHFLSQHDINFYLATRPADFMTWASVLAGVAAVTLALIIWNALRWRWVVHVLLFENTTVGAAFTRSAALVKGIALQTALKWGAIGVLNLALGLLAAWIGRLILPLVVGFLGESLTSIGAVFGCLLVFQALIGSMILMAGPIIEANVFTRGYFQRSGVRLSGHIDSPAPSSDKSQRVFTPTYAVVVLTLVTIGGVMGGIKGTEALALDRPVKVIAHRGAMMDAPENSVLAIERSIADGADVLETDVQLTKDGVAILFHDSDFSRMGGVAKKVADLTWDEIKAIDIGSTMGTQFKDVRVARLDDVLVLARGRIHLNIEPKHYGPVDGKLEAEIVRLIQHYSDVNQIEIQALEYESLMVVRQLDPRIKIGYLLSVNARHTGDLKVDFLSVQASRADARFLRKARKAGQAVYVWTVDNLDQMEYLFDLGVDGIITNQSPTAIKLIKDRLAMSPEEKAVRRIRSWLAR